MNTLLSSSSSTSVPRVDSLLHRLQHAPLPEDGSPSYLDQLMIFLEDPPRDVRDRWKQAADMCIAWGFATTGPSVWRLYQSHVLEWRLLLAHETESAAATEAGTVGKKLAKIAERRAFEALTNPQLSPECLVRLAQLELRKEILAFDRLRHRDNNRDKAESAFQALAQELPKNSDVVAAFEKLRDTRLHELERLEVPEDQVT